MKKNVYYQQIYSYTVSTNDIVSTNDNYIKIYSIQTRY